MPTVTIPFGTESIDLTLPGETDLLRMKPVPAIADPGAAIREALRNPIASEPLPRIIADKLKVNPNATAVVVIADHTRPVPYKGEQGILWPVIEALVLGGVTPANITVLVGTGTHRPLVAEIESMLDPRVFSCGATIASHDCTNRTELVAVGTGSDGSEVTMNRRYVDSDIRIATGLVESHFFAGSSGGRKAICPGVVGEEVTHRFHSARSVASPQSTHLVLDGNPHHEMAMEIATMAPPDFTVNVTLTSDYRVAGVFAGEMDAAHRTATDHIRSYVEIPIEGPYEIVLTHGGYVSINHYQAAKPALVAAQAVSESGWMFLAAANTDLDPVGSRRYRTLLHLLRLIGPAAFERLLFSDDWTFLPDQWEVQAWARIDANISRDRFWYFSPQCSEADYGIFPGSDGNHLLEPGRRYRGDKEDVQRSMDGFLARARARLAAQGNRRPRIAFLCDGPYGIVKDVSAT